MKIFENQRNKKAVLGLVHLLPLPGTPYHKEGNFDLALEKALIDVKALQNGGADGCLVQTVDGIYPPGDEVDPARLAALAAIVYEVSKIKQDDFQVGVQIMINGLHGALAIAKVFDGSYLRCAAFVGKMISGSGTVEANPYEFQKYRRYLNALDIKIIAEVDGMHFHWVNNEKTTKEVAQLAKYSGAHAVEVAAADEKENQLKVLAVKEINPEIPVVLGGYTNHENASRRLANADGAFVGTCLEKEGWGGNIDEDLVKDYVKIVNSL